MSPRNRVRPTPPTPLVLIILDGWGVRQEQNFNAIALANTPNIDSFYSRYPTTALSASEHSVGLPQGQMGNSEVGHLNIGAGRIVEMDITRIDRSLDDGSFYENRTLLQAMREARSRRLHMIGLLSDGGVHSHLNHLFGLLDLARRSDVSDVVVHPLLDGRDTPPTSGEGYIKELQAAFKRTNVGRIGTVCGRYYAMDRDNRWPRIQRAYEAMVMDNGTRCSDPLLALRDSYQQKITDEFVEPINVAGPSGDLGLVADGDVMIFFNFRADRMRELVETFTTESFTRFERRDFPRTHAYCFTKYDGSFHLPVAYPPQHFTDILGQILARHDLRNLRIAETEKYAHVTYFFNGGEETEFPGERRVLVPSPRVPTYDQKPEMSAHEVTDRLLAELDKDDLDVVICNLANADMVGHTGNLDAAIKAVETVDHCLGRVASRVLEKQGTMLVTADHGNAELMFDTSRNEPHTAHTTNPVPFIVVSERFSRTLRMDGNLEDISPTMLELLNLEVPKKMTGRSLLCSVE